MSRKVVTTRLSFATRVCRGLITFDPPMLGRLLQPPSTFHRGGRIAQLIEAVGCRLLYLPAYSPDLNRIEKCWAWLKSRIRKGLSTSDSLR